MKQASMSVCGNTPEITVREWLGVSRRLEFRRDLRVWSLMEGKVAART